MNRIKQAEKTLMRKELLRLSMKKSSILSRFNSEKSKFKRSPAKGANLRCDLCGLKSATKTVLTFHMDSVHRNERFKCQLCNKVFSIMRKLRYHVKTHKEREYLECLLCDAKYTVHAGLRFHVLSHHPDKKAETTFTCDSCNSEFYSKLQLERHMKYHSGLFKCFNKLCLKGFRSRDALRKHYLCSHNSDIKVNFY